MRSQIITALTHVFCILQQIGSLHAPRNPETLACALVGERDKFTRTIDNSNREKFSASPAVQKQTILEVLAVQEYQWAKLWTFDAIRDQEQGHWRSFAKSIFVEFCD